MLIAVLAFVIASPGGDDNSDKASQTETDTGSAPGTKAVVISIDIRGGKVPGGPAEFRVKHGDRVAISVGSDAPDDVHLHGYDIEKKVKPGQRADFRFTANLEGQFEIESHKAEDAGRDPLLGTLIVEPK
ncbi:MAG TPA: hypothetical protein VK486_01010 [Thermoleophilaceae bacterium]|nr:hypothetical protein [Thermoleophilaceae bacterium]